MRYSYVYRLQMAVLVLAYFLVVGGLLYRTKHQMLQRTQARALAYAEEVDAANERADRLKAETNYLRAQLATMDSRLYNTQDRLEAAENRLRAIERGVVIPQETRREVLRLHKAGQLAP